MAAKIQDMIMNRKHLLGIGLLTAAMLLTGCSAEILDGHSGQVPIYLTASVQEGGAQGVTRAGTDVQSTQLPNGEEFYGYFPSGATVSSATFTANGSGGTTANPQPYFTLTDNETTVHAYHGKSGGTDQVTNETSSFSVATDQSSDAAYRASDLMYATATVTKSGLSATGELTFSHKMAKIIVNATMGSGITSITAVKIVGGSKTINIATPQSCTLGSTLSDDNSSANITVYSGTHTSGTLSCAALIPPQRVPTTGSTATNFLQIVTDKGTVTYSLNGKQFSSNNVYTFNVTLTSSQVGTTVAITDWADNGNATVTVGVAPSLTPASLEFTFGDAAKTITASNVGSAWSALSDNTSVATVAGLTVTPVNVGTATVHVWPTSDITGAFSSAACPVTVSALTLQTTSSSTNGYVTFGSIPTQQWTGSAVEPAAPTITVKVNGETNTLTASDYDISYSNNTDGGTSAVMTITGKGNYTGSVSTNFTIDKDPGVSLASATVGMVIGANGKAYTTIALANKYSTAAAIIAYKGNGEANSSYNTGLAISLADVSVTKKWKSSADGTCTAQNSSIATIRSDLQGLTHTATLCSSEHTSHGHDAATAADGYTSTMATPTGCSKWFLPTIGQWNLIVKAMCGGSANLTTSNNSSYKAAEFNKKIRVAYGESESTACAGDVQDSGGYWSSVEYSTSNAWGMFFGSGRAYYNSKTNRNYVRPVLAF